MFQRLRRVQGRKYGAQRHERCELQRDGTSSKAACADTSSRLVCREQHHAEQVSCSPDLTQPPPLEPPISYTRPFQVARHVVHIQLPTPVLHVHSPHSPTPPHLQVGAAVQQRRGGHVRAPMRLVGHVQVGECRERRQGRCEVLRAYCQLALR